MKTKTNYLFAVITIAVISFSACCDPNSCKLCENNTLPSDDSISIADASVMIQHFLDSTRNHRSDTIKGVFFSKATLCKIIEDTNYQGAFVYFALTDSNQYRLFMHGGRTDNQTFTDNQPSTVSRSRIYCPPTCAKLLTYDSIPKPKGPAQ